jgi:hypothetical protein
MALHDNEKHSIADANHIERTETMDNDIALAKVAVDAKVDEFGARSKTNPEEIALVKKLDRTILVCSSNSISKTPLSDMRTR